MSGGTSGVMNGGMKYLRDWRLGRITGYVMASEKRHDAASLRTDARYYSVRCIIMHDAVIVLSYPRLEWRLRAAKGATIVRRSPRSCAWPRARHQKHKSQIKSK